MTFRPPPRPDAPARLAWRVLLAVLLAVVSGLALTPGPPAGAGLGWDKANHVLAFTALALCASLAFDAVAGLPRRVALALLAYGVAIELAQSQIPGRSADGHDLVADGLGVAAGLLLAHLCTRLWTRRSRR